MSHSWPARSEIYAVEYEMDDRRWFNYCLTSAKARSEFEGHPKAIAWYAVSLTYRKWSA